MSRDPLLDITLREYLESKSKEGTPILDKDEILDFVKKVGGMLQGNMTIEDLGIYKELSKIVDFISVSRQEIVNLIPHELKNEHIPTCSEALEVITQTTEKGVQEILSCAEEIDQITSLAPKDIAEKLQAISIRIYEASNFEDLNGQRIRKVIESLSYIEQHVHLLMDRLRIDENEVTEKVVAQKHKDELMNGPQSPQKAYSQEEIDALFS